MSQSFSLKYIKTQVNLLQIFYWISFCSISGFATVFLLSRELSNSAIGLIISLASLLSVLAQFLIGILIDRYSTWTVKKVMTVFLVWNVYCHYLLFYFNKRL